MNDRKDGGMIMLVRTNLTAAVCSALLFASGSTLAADSGLYLTLSLGLSNSNFDTSATLAAAGAPAGAAVSTDSSAFSWKEILGYQINRSFAVELSFVSLGKYDFTVSAPATAPATGKVTISGYGIAGVGSIPVGQDLSFFGKLGYFQSNISALTSVPIFRSGTVAGENERTWVPNYGIGLKYDINSTLALRGEMERFQGMGSSTSTVKTNANLFTIGLSYKF